MSHETSGHNFVPGLACITMLVSGPPALGATAPATDKSQKVSLSRHLRQRVDCITAAPAQ